MTHSFALNCKLLGTKPVKSVQSLQMCEQRKDLWTRLDIHHHFNKKLAFSYSNNSQGYVSNDVEKKSYLLFAPFPSSSCDTLGYMQFDFFVCLLQERKSDFVQFLNKNQHILEEGVDKINVLWVSSMVPKSNWQGIKG